MKAKNSNPSEAAALARVAEAAREVQAASAAIEARFTAVGERQASALELARLTAAVQELENARLALAVVIDAGNRRGRIASQRCLVTSNEYVMVESGSSRRMAEWVTRSARRCERCYRACKLRPYGTLENRRIPN